MIGIAHSADSHRRFVSAMALSIKRNNVTASAANLVQRKPYGLRLATGIYKAQQALNPSPVNLSHHSRWPPLGFRDIHTNITSTKGCHQLQGRAKNVRRPMRRRRPRV